MKVLVTGAAGTMGRHVVPRLAANHEVFALTRGDAPAELADSATWVRQDLTEPLDPAALPGAIDAVVHLAQSRRYRDFPDGAEDVFAVNVESTLALLRWATGAGASRFVLASTGGVYGTGDPEPVTESSPLRPEAPYFRSKRMAELLLEDWSELITPVVLRFFFVYGPGDGTTLVPRLADSILEGREIVIQGDPGMRMNPLHVVDAAAAIEAALALDGPAVVNVAGAETIALSELVERLAASLDREALVRHTDEEPGDLVAATDAMRERLGVSPAVSLDEGLATVAADRVARS